MPTNYANVYRYIAIFFLGIAQLSFVSLANADEVNLQLKWKHAFQFAGYYMAKEKGFYADAGLEVNIIEGNPNISPIDYALKGEGFYAVSDTGVLLAKQEGKAIQVLAAIFQHSPLALAVRADSGIHSFSDLKGKRVMMQQGYMDAVILAALYRAGLSNADFIRQDNSFNIHDLIDGHTDAFSVYTTDQPHQLREMGIDYHILSPVEYDVDFYGDILVTSRSETKRNPARAGALTAASIKGWRYALENVNETVELIQKKYNTQNLTSSQLYFEAKKTADTILKDEVELGYMSEFRWRQTAKVYAELGLISESFVLDDFIYQAPPSAIEFFQVYKWQFIFLSLFILLVFFASQSYILRSMVRSRTQQLQVERENLKKSKTLQTSISTVLEMVASDKPMISVFESIIEAFESRYPEMKASILILRDNKLYKGAAPNLPQEYNKAIEGLKIGPMVGSCGTAAYLKKRIVVEDIATDEHWAPYKELALPLNLLACWSEPIINANGEVMGTFAMYYDHPRAPTEYEIDDITNAAKLAGLAMERKLVQDSLRKLSQATHQAGESVQITDEQGVIEYINPSYSKLTGYSGEEVIGTVSKLFKGGNQTDDYYDRLESTLLSGQIWNTQIICERKDGSCYTSMVSISPIMGEDKEVTHYVCIQNDMSDYEMLEEKFRQAQKMEALGTLVGGIAHNFNNTLAGITGNLYLAKKKISDFPDVIQHIEKVEKLSFHAADTVKQLLTFARKGSLEKKPFALTSFLKDVFDLHKSAVPENINFTQSYCEEELVVHGDATQIQQALLNLINNARDAVADVDSPMIALTIDAFEANDSFIEAHPHFEGQSLVHISIKDNGMGIDEDFQEHVFEPFFTTKDVGSGTGLGLSMVYGAIQSHGGYIEIGESSTKGTLFDIYLPRLDNTLLNESIDSSDTEVHGGRECILIVDDNEDVRESGKAVLESFGYQVLEAEDGLMAVDVYRKNESKIDLMIIDIVMPKLGGVEAAKQIKEINPQAKIIFASGYDKDEVLKDGYAIGDALVVSKPYEVEILAQMVRKQLDAEA